MRPFLFIVFAILLLQAPVGASPKHDRAARAAWAWISVSRGKEEAPAPAPVAGECNCAKGFKCDCSPCLCPGCPSKNGWTWSDREGGYWWRNKPEVTSNPPVVPTPTPGWAWTIVNGKWVLVKIAEPAPQSAYNPVGFSRGGSRSGGC